MCLADVAGSAEANTSQATLRIDLNAAAPTGAWTVALWEILEVKDNYLQKK